MKEHFQIHGTVRAETGEPVVGALVMGVDLGWAETAADGTFTVLSPEMALLVWCSGYYPSAALVRRGVQRMEITMRAVRMAKAAAGN